MSAIDRVAAFLTAHAYRFSSDIEIGWALDANQQAAFIDRPDLEALLADARRLQWLEDSRVDCETLASGWILDSEHWKPTLREVIDDAMEQAK